MAQRFDHTKESRRGDWHCMVQQEPWNLVTKVYLIRHKGDGHADMATIEKGKMVLTDITTDMTTKPLLELPYDAWQTVLGVFGEIEPDIKHEVVDAELKATKYHLEDMRKLAMKKLSNSKVEE